MTMSNEADLFDAKALMAAASAAIGLSDFGDTAFLEPLEIYLKSLDEQAKLNLIKHYEEIAKLYRCKLFFSPFPFFLANCCTHRLILNCHSKSFHLRWIELLGDPKGSPTPPLTQ